MCGLASGLLNSSVLFLRIWRVEDDYFSSLGCKKGATVVRLWTSRGFIVALSYSSVFLGGLFLSERLPLPPVEYGSVWSLSEQTWHADLNKHTWPQHGAPCAVSPRREKACLLCGSLHVCGAVEAGRRGEASGSSVRDNGANEAWRTARFQYVCCYYPRLFHL